MTRRGHTRDAQRRAGGHGWRCRGTAKPGRYTACCGAAAVPASLIPLRGTLKEAFRSGKDRSGSRAAVAAATRPERHRAAPRVVTFGRGGARRSARGRECGA